MEKNGGHCAARSNVGKRTSQRVLDLLKTRGALCAAQLSESLDMTEQGVRRHLARLSEEGLISAQIEKPLGRGRPQQVYTLTEQGEARFPKTYQTLCIALLEQMEAEFGEGTVRQILFGRAQVVTDRLAGRWPAQLSPEDRLARLTEEFRAAGHDSVIERGQEEGTFYLLHQNCPYLTVAQEFGDICQAEQQVIANLLGLDADVRSSNLCCEGRIVTGDCCCRYHIEFGVTSADQEGSHDKS